MKRLILSLLAVLGIASTAKIVTCQFAPATEGIARELIEAMLRQGGREAATELAELGGEAAVRQVLGRAMNEGGGELVERISQYATRFGPAALRAVETSPKLMVQALDEVSPELVGSAVRAAARQPEVVERLVAAYGKDALELAAKHPGVGARLAEKLGSDGIRVGEKLTTDQAVTLARHADEIAALAPGERNRLLQAMIKAPAAVLDYLESHPKILLTAGGVAAVIAATDSLFGGTGATGKPGAQPEGLVERVIFHELDRFFPLVVTGMAIVIGGACCYATWRFRRASKNGVGNQTK